MAYNLLKGKRGIITGALDENSIAWKVAVRAKEEGRYLHPYQRARGSAHGQNQRAWPSSAIQR
ncbi:MAG: hypothetical protein KatS3mg033_1941 [Thermonema sp.]|nr:MAG: hypothetical protein KatS3mg033_1941 [Thermonema sp.]